MQSYATSRGDAHTVEDDDDDCIYESAPEEVVIRYGTFDEMQLIREKRQTETSWNEQISDALKNVELAKNFVISFFNQGVDKPVHLMKATGDTVVYVFKEIGDKLVQVAEQLTNIAKGFVKFVGEEVVHVAERVGNVAVNSVKQATDYVGEVAKEVGSTVVHVCQQVGLTVVSTCRQTLELFGITATTD